MIIWKGMGSLDVIIYLGIFILVDFLLTSVGLEDLPANLSTVFSLFIAGTIIWFAGKKLNENSNKVLVDPDTGQQFRMGTKQHILFFIPMHYWGPLLGIVE